MTICHEARYMVTYSHVYIAESELEIAVALSH